MASLTHDDGVYTSSFAAVLATQAHMNGKKRSAQEASKDEPLTRLIPNFEDIRIEEIGLDKKTSNKGADGKAVGGETAYIKSGGQSRRFVIKKVRFPFVINPCTNINELMGAIHPDDRPNNVISHGFKEHEKLSLYIEYDDLEHAEVVLKGVALNDHLLNIIFERKEEYLPSKILSAMTKAKDPLDVLRGNFTSTFFREAENKDGKRRGAHTYGKIVGWGRFIRSVKVKEKKDKDGKATGSWLADTTEYEMRDYDPFDAKEYKEKNKGTVPTLFKIRIPNTDKYVPYWPMREDGALFAIYDKTNPKKPKLLNPVMTDARGKPRMRNLGPQDITPGSTGTVVIDLQGINFGDSLSGKPIITSISFERAKPKPKETVDGEQDASEAEMMEYANLGSDEIEGETDSSAEAGATSTTASISSIVAGAGSAFSSGPTADDFEAAERSAGLQFGEIPAETSAAPATAATAPAPDADAPSQVDGETAATVGTSVTDETATGSSASSSSSAPVKEKKHKRVRQDASAASATGPLSSSTSAGDNDEASNTQVFV